MPREVLFYTGPRCPDCLRAERFLDEHDVRFTTVDIAAQPGAAEKLERETGKRGIPFLVIDGEWVRAYEPGGGPFPRARLLRALGID